jgi:hypothetical protein
LLSIIQKKLNELAYILLVGKTVLNYYDFSPANLNLARYNESKPQVMLLLIKFKYQYSILEIQEYESVADIIAKRFTSVSI